MPYHLLPAVQLAKNLAFRSLSPSSSSSFSTTAKKAATRSSKSSALPVRTTPPSMPSSSAKAPTTLGCGEHAQRITVTCTYWTGSIELDRRVGRWRKVKRRIGYVEVEDDTASGIQSTSIARDKAHHPGGPQHRHVCSGTGVMHASTSLCASTVKNAANTSAMTPTDISDPLRSLNSNRCAEARVHDPTRLLPNLSRPSPAAAPDLELTFHAAPSLPASLTFHHAQNNDDDHENGPNALPDRTTLLLLGLLFLIVGILSYTLRRFLYTYYPPHILPCVVSPSSLHGWRGSDFRNHGERDEGDDYGWPSTYYSNHSGSSHSDCASYHPRPPHTARPSSPPPPPPQQQQPQNKNGRKLHKPPMLDLLKARVTRITTQPHHRPRISRNDPERDLEAACDHHLLLPPPPHKSPNLAQDSHPRRSESREVVLRYRNPFDWTPTPTPSPVPLLRRAQEPPGGWGGENDVEAFEMESPLGLSRYFENDGVGILDM